jgi:hypothetical protein
MPYRDHKGFVDTRKLASNAVIAAQPVGLDTVEGQVVPIGSVNIEPYGVLDVASAARGNQVTVYGQDSIVRVQALASLGAGADIGVASTNGQLTFVVAGASGAGVKYRVGKSLEAAAAGANFALYVSPRQIAGFLP